MPFKSMRGTGGHKLCGFVCRSVALCQMVAHKIPSSSSCGFLVPFPSFFFPFSPFLDGSAGEYTGWDLMTVCSCICVLRNSLIPSLISTAEKEKKTQKKARKNSGKIEHFFVEKETRAVQFFFQGYNIHPSVISCWVVHFAL